MINLANNWKKSARGVALLVLEDILDEKAYSNIALSRYLKSSDLSDKDKGLVTEIVYGTIARKITLEWYLAHFVKDRDKLENWVYYLLMMSLYQFLYLDKNPTYAVVNAAVEIAKNRGNKRGAEKFINALLRRITQEKLPDISTIKRKNKRYSVSYSLPVWLVNKLIDYYGQGRAQAIMESLFVRNKASIRVVNSDMFNEISEVTESQISELSPVGLVKLSGNFAATNYFVNGDIAIQDESSQLVAPTMAIQGDEQILDACSAPGGKTVHIASYLTTGHITALDLYDHKLDLVTSNAERLHVGEKITVQKMDASQAHQNFGPNSFDKILVDAPCSGIGLIRRKPDIKYNKDNQDLADLQRIQLQILDSVCQTLRKDGIITYSTCTLFDEENIQVIQKFLETHPNFEQVNLSHAKTDIMKDGCISITPEQYQTDGFFIGQVRRIL